MRSTAWMLLLLPLVVWAADDQLGRCSAFYNNYKDQAITTPCFKMCLSSGNETEGAMCNRTISFDPAAHQEMCYDFYEVNGLSNCPEECGGKCERPTTTATETSGSVLTTTDTSSQSPSSTASTVPSTASETTSTGASSAETSSTATSSETVTTPEPTSSENTTANPDLGSIVTIPPLGDPSTNGSTSSESSTASSSSSTSDEETTVEAITTSAAENSPEINTSPILPPPLPEETPKPRISLTDEETDDPRWRQRTGKPHRRRETAEKEEGGGSLLWLWIILGVGGSLVVLALITLIAIRCMKKRKEKNKKEAQKSDVESGRSVGLSNQQLPLPPPNATPLGAHPPPGRPVKRRPAHKKQKEKKPLPLKEMAPGKVDAEHFNFEGPLVVDATGIHGELKHGTDGEKSKSIKDVVFDDKLNHVYDMGSDIEVVVQSVEKTIDGGNSMSTVEGGNTVKETAPTPKAAAPKETAKKAEKK